MKIRDLMTADGVSLAALDVNQLVYTVQNRHTGMRPRVEQHPDWKIRCANHSEVLIETSTNYERPGDVYAYEVNAYNRLATLFEAMTQEAREAAEIAARKEPNP